MGGFAHRLPRRRLLIVLNVARASFVICLPFVTEIWQIYLLIFLLNACSAGFTSTFQAMIPGSMLESAGSPASSDRCRLGAGDYPSTIESEIDVLGMHCRR